MAEKPLTARARVVVTLDIDSGSTWGPECTVGQIFKQAGEESVLALRNLLKRYDVNIVGEPKVTYMIGTDK